MFCSAQGSQHAKILQEEALRQAEQRRRIRATMAPTADADVRRVLRQIGHPVTLFGEREVRESSRVCGALLLVFCAACSVCAVWVHDFHAALLSTHGAVREVGHPVRSF